MLMGGRPNELLLGGQRNELLLGGRPSEWLLRLRPKRLLRARSVRHAWRPHNCGCLLVRRRKALLLRRALTLIVDGVDPRC